VHCFSSCESRNGPQSFVHHVTGKPVTVFSVTVSLSARSSTSLYRLGPLQRTPVRVASCFCTLTAADKRGCLFLIRYDRHKKTRSNDVTNLNNGPGCLLSVWLIIYCVSFSISLFPFYVLPSNNFFIDRLLSFIYNYLS
jgi:hypothetical protein